MRGSGSQQRSDLHGGGGCDGGGGGRGGGDGGGDGGEGGGGGGGMHPSGHGVVQGPWRGRARAPRCDCAATRRERMRLRGGEGVGGRARVRFGFGFWSGSGLGAGPSSAHRGLESGRQLGRGDELLRRLARCARDDANQPQLRSWAQGHVRIRSTVAGCDACMRLYARPAGLRACVHGVCMGCACCAQYGSSARLSRSSILHVVGFFGRGCGLGNRLGLCGRRCRWLCSTALQRRLGLDPGLGWQWGKRLR